MTPILSREESSATMKQKLIRDAPAKKTRSFLDFSRENLSVSQSDLEQGFNRPRLVRPSRSTILSAAALVVAILCFGLQSWKLLLNTREIEQLRIDVNILQNKFLERLNGLDLMDKTLEEQLNESTESDNEPDIYNADYDSNYDDDGSASHDYSGRGDILFSPVTYGLGARSLDFRDITSTSIPIPTSPDSGANKDMVELLAALRKVEAKHGQDFERNVRENHKNIEREHFKEGHENQSSHEEKTSDANSTRYKLDTTASKVTSSGHIKENIKSKRSINNLTDYPVRDIANDKRHNTRITRRIVIRTRSNVNESDANDNSGTDPTAHPPKKYHAHTLETIPPARHDRLREETTQPDRHGSTEIASDRTDRRIKWRNRDVSGNRTDIRRPIQVYATHYEADSTLFSMQDDYTGNGRARHNNGVFRAWQPSEWVADLGMNRHFTLAGDGKLTVHESGLYLVYAQIHYLDEHDENGFHVLVNSRPLLQCTAYSPGMGHKSHSCFSAQVTILHAGDHLVLKDISARYTLFQYDKSFFGLVKVGELRQQQRHPPTH